MAKLYEVLKDAALMHSPEAVPFLSELLEDGDAEVRTDAVSLLKELESLSGKTPMDASILDE